MKSFNECAITKFVANFIVEHSTKELLCKWNYQENIKAFNAIVKINQRASPKKGKSAYNFFCLEMRPQLKKELGKEGKLITAELSKRWKIVKENKDLLDKYTKMTENDCYKKEKTSCESVQSQKVSVVNAKCITDEYKNMTSCEEKEKIKKRFDENVRGRKPENLKAAHDGAEGHWLEDCMGIKHNASKEPDIFGYEMKKSSSKISFFDLSASEYLFSTSKVAINKANNWEEGKNSISKPQFIHYFGTLKEDKNRYSWSGKCFPIHGSYNFCGQIITISDTNDICIYYSHSKDQRKDVDIPDFLKRENVLIAIWTEDKLKNHVNKKFNNKGFFICKKTNYVYDKLCFGKPFDFEHFMKNFKNRTIFIDSGMADGNSRNYSTFRSTPKDFWTELIVEEY
jgi:hypothetical protein